MPRLEETKERAERQLPNLATRQLGSNSYPRSALPPPPACRVSTAAKFLSLPLVNKSPAKSNVCSGGRAWERVVVMDAGLAGVPLGSQGVDPNPYRFE